jgi:hypothetical protein
MSLVDKGDNTKNIIKELNKEWREYTKRVDGLIEVKPTKTQKNVTFIIRRKKGCNISLCDIFEDEIKKLQQMLDNI